MGLVALLRGNCPSIRSKFTVGVGEGFLEVRFEGGAEVFGVIIGVIGVLEGNPWFWVDTCLGVGPFINSKGSWDGVWGEEANS